MVNIKVRVGKSLYTNCTFRQCHSIKKFQDGKVSSVRSACEKGEITRYRGQV